MKKIYLHNTKPKELFRKYLRKKSWNWFDWDQNYFLKPNDGISHLPLRGEVHDEEVVQALIFLAKKLPSTFLDIGANIGLISLKISDHVDKVICIEANPLICNILRVNMALNSKNYSIQEYALGKSSETATLYVPHHNLGGAFLLTSNQYNLNQLAQKDGYTHYEERNYLPQKVTVRKCSDVLNEIKNQEDSSLLIKVDIEGLDLMVLEDIIKIFSELFQLQKIAMVFEGHDEAIAQYVQEKIDDKYGVYGLKILSTPNIRHPIIRRFLKILQGENKELSFTHFSEISKKQNIKNFVCCPKIFIEQI